MPYNIVVLIKQIPDIDQMKTDQNTGEPQTQNLPLRIENLSKNAIEAAVQIKEKNGGKVTGVIFGGEKANAAMKEAYAMGVDEGFVITGFRENSPALTAKVLAEKLKGIEHDLVILGNQSADTYTGMLPGMLSGLTGAPLVGNAVGIEPQDGSVNVTRVLEDHNVVLSSRLPAIISVAQEINEPRIPPVLQIMAAGRKPINTEQASITDGADVKIISDRAPKSDRKRQVFEDPEKGVPEIVKVIKEVVR